MLGLEAQAHAGSTLWLVYRARAGRRVAHRPPWRAVCTDGRVGQSGGMHRRAWWGSAVCTDGLCVADWQSCGMHLQAGWGCRAVCTDGSGEAVGRYAPTAGGGSRGVCTDGPGGAVGRYDFGLLGRVIMILVVQLLLVWMTEAIFTEG